MNYASVNHCLHQLTVNTRNQLLKKVTIFTLNTITSCQTKSLSSDNTRNQLDKIIIFTVNTRTSYQTKSLSSGNTKNQLLNFSCIGYLDFVSTKAICIDKANLLPLQNWVLANCLSLIDMKRIATSILFSCLLTPSAAFFAHGRG